MEVAGHLDKLTHAFGRGGSTECDATRARLLRDESVLEFSRRGSSRLKRPGPRGAGRRDEFGGVDVRIPLKLAKKLCAVGADEELPPQVMGRLRAAITNAGGGGTWPPPSPSVSASFNAVGTCWRPSVASRAAGKRPLRARWARPRRHKPVEPHEPREERRAPPP